MDKKFKNSLNNVDDQVITHKNPLAEYDGKPREPRELTEEDYAEMARIEDMEYAYEDRIIECATQDISWRGEWD